MIKELETLLKTREIRELSAATKVQVCRDKLTASRDQRRRREKNIKDYQNWLKKQENKLLAALKNAPVTAIAIQEFRMTTAKLKDKEISLFDRVQKAKKSVKNARQALTEAKKEHLEVTKAKEKLKEFIAIQKKKSNSDVIYKEEQESEFDAILKTNPLSNLLH